MTFVIIILVHCNSFRIIGYSSLSLDSHIHTWVLVELSDQKDPQLPKISPFPLIFSQVYHISLLEHKDENLPHISHPEKKNVIKSTVS